MKKDWSLGHLLYYLSGIGIGGVIIKVGILILMLFQNGDFVVWNMHFVDPLIEIRDMEIEDESLVTNEGNYLIPITIYARFTLFNLDGLYQPQAIKTYYMRFLKCLLEFLFLFQLSQLFKSIKDQNPFNKENPRRFYYMGILVIALAMADIWSGFIFSNGLREIGFQTLKFNPSFEMKPNFIFGLIIILFGVVFKEANRIHEEQKLTV